MRTIRILLTLAFALLLGGACQAEARAAKLAFVGDSMADGIWGAFFRVTGNQKCPSAVIDLIRDARNGSGLARPDHYDWEKDLDTLISGEQPDVVLASIGLNDRQALVTRDRQQIRLGTDEWLANYRANVESFYKHAAAGGARVLVIGLPVLRDAKANAHAQLVNQIFADVAKSDATLNVTYVQPWQSDDGDGSFASFGHDLGGATVEIRAPDGIHFTQAGYDLLAAYLKSAVSSALAEKGVPVDATCFGK